MKKSNKSSRRSTPKSSFGCCTNIMNNLLLLDQYSYNPLSFFNYTTNKNHNNSSQRSYFSLICSIISIIAILYFICITIIEYITQSPQLIKQGSKPLPITPNQITFESPPVAFELSYLVQDTTSSNWTQVTLDATNNDPHFRYNFVSKTMRGIDDFPTDLVSIQGVECSDNFHGNVFARHLICPDEDIRRKQTIQGSFGYPKHQFFEVEIRKCEHGGDSNCATMQEIDDIINNGNVKVTLYTKEEKFDEYMYHQHENGGYEYNPQRGFYEKLRRWRFFALPGQQQLTDIFMEGKVISLQRPWLGSMNGPIYTTLNFNKIDTIHKSGGINVMTFTFLLYDRVTEESIQYRIRSVLDLFSVWGAFAAFITIFSVGAVARWYNRRWALGSNLQKQVKEYIQFCTKKGRVQGPECYVFEDLRFLDKKDFTPYGKIRITKEEFHHPTSLVGEMRRIACIEHWRRQNAAYKINSWYSKHKCRRKFELIIQTSKNMATRSSLLKRGASPCTAINTPSTTNESITPSNNTSPETINEGSTSLPKSGQSQTGPDGINSSFPFTMLSDDNNHDNKNINDSSVGKETESKDDPSLCSSTAGRHTLVSNSTQDANSIKARILEHSLELVKQAKHNRQKKPWTELIKCMTQDAVDELFDGIERISNTDRLMTWKLNGPEISKWLGLKEELHIHPVNFEGKVVCAPGQKPSVYSWAKYETCDAKYNKKSNILTLRFQTYLSGTGLPDKNGNPQFTY